MERWIQRAKKGDEAAFSQLVTPLRPRLLYKVLTITKDWEMAEDVVQEALFTSYQKLEQLKEARYFETWVMTIAIRLAYQHVQKELETIPLEESVIASIQHENEREEVLVLLKELRESEARLLQTYYFSGYSIREIAEHWELSESAIKTKLHRARRAFRRVYERQRGGIEMTEEKRLQRQYERAKEIAGVATPPTIIDYDEEEGTYVIGWEEDVMLTLTKEGRLQSYDREVEVTGEHQSLEPLRRIAEQWLVAHIGPVFSQYRAERFVARKESVTFYYEQEAGGLPLPYSGCYVKITMDGQVSGCYHYGEVTIPEVKDIVQPSAILEHAARHVTFEKVIDEGRWVYVARNETYRADVATPTLLYNWDIEDEPSSRAMSIVWPKETSLSWQQMLGVDKARILRTREEPKAIVYGTPRERPKNPMSFETYFQIQSAETVKVTIDEKTNLPNGAFSFRQEKGEKTWTEKKRHERALHWLQVVIPHAVPSLVEIEREFSDEPYVFHWVNERGDQLAHLSVQVSEVTGAVTYYAGTTLTADEAQQLTETEVWSEEEVRADYVDRMSVTKRWERVEGVYVLVYDIVDQSTKQPLERCDAITGKWES